MAIELHLFGESTSAQRVARLIKGSPRAKICCVLLRANAERVKKLISGADMSRVVFVYPDAVGSDIAVPRENLSTLMITIQEVLGVLDGEKQLIFDGPDVLEMVVPQGDLSRFFIFLANRLQRGGISGFLVQPRKAKPLPIVVQLVDRVVN